ncbi:TonB-dependent receptor domain-containing protein [Sedimentitalea nanhaiensis]|uniref:Hemoglobin/transferrin/lactoferrin receptor protein n=1 Tax=Sedimentitalea nanhaiensis TaxID=999627 RepID=A0A1I7DWS7_9RHOB|nr:TonB-dependent receptor [Sedimentitalea nanhaiensis]SFU16086.1 hemoglobin/transferrin/lactoferrin receptor protein [Sedimentitalea nanhaiensis]
MYYSTKRAYLWATTALIAGLSFAAPVFAQAQAEVDLGVLVLGLSKRDVQTDTATAVTEVDQEEIDDRQAGTVAELVDSVPGVNLVNGSTPQGSGINVRGFGSNATFGSDQKVKIIVDGADVGAEELYRIGTQLFTDPELYRSVEVIRGTVGSFEYGSGVVGGVIRLETKDASDFTGGEPGFVGNQALQFSSNGDGITSSTILAWQPNENLELLANYTIRDENVPTDGSGTPIGTKGFKLPSVLLKAKYTFGDAREHSLAFSYTDSSTDDRDVPYDTFTTTGVGFGNVDRQTESRTASLSYDYNPSGNDLIDLNVVLSYADQEIISEGTSGQTGFLAALVNADQRYETTKLAFKNTSLFETGALSHNLRAGLEFIRKERLNASSAPGGTDNRVAIFAVDEMSIGNAWTITPALRYETSKIKGSTAPNNGAFDNSALMGGISVRYAFDNGFAIFGSAAYTENLPILDDLGNPAFMVTSEKARTWEFGAAYNGTDVFQGGDRLAVKANIYFTTLWDVTSYQAAGLPFNSPINFIETKGLELEASYSMASGRYVDLNANISRGNENHPGGTTADWRGIPADTVQFTLGKQFGEELDLSWEVVADRRYTRSTTPVPGFAVHNLRATYALQQGILEGAEIRIGVENLFDKQYTRRLSTRPARGRNVKLTLAKSF